MMIKYGIDAKVDMEYLEKRLGFDFRDGNQEYIVGDYTNGKYTVQFDIVGSVIYASRNRDDSRRYDYLDAERPNDYDYWIKSYSLADFTSYRKTLG